MPRKAQRVSEVIAAQLSEWRRFRDLTADDLAERVAALGGHLGRVAITKIETGRRGVSVDEALMLAAALNVPPPLLFFPMRTGDHVEITRRSVIHPDLATRWLAGEGPLAITDRRAMRMAEWSEAAWTEAGRPLRLYERHREAQRRIHECESDVRRAEFVKDETAAKRARTRYAQRLRELADARSRMRAEGMTPPKLPAEWTADLKKLGVEEEG